VCALPAELRYFTARSGIEVFACGVGPVEAAAAVARKLALERYEAVLNVGIAGAFPSRGKVGEAFLVVEEALADVGLEGGGPLTLPDGYHLVEREEAEPELVGRCAGAGLRSARGLTVAQVTSTAATGARLAARYGADLESMEGFSVLRAAALARIPALEVRGVSNYVGDRAHSEWDFRAGARAAAAALEAVLDRLTA